MHTTTKAKTKTKDTAVSKIEDCVTASNERTKYSLLLSRDGGEITGSHCIAKQGGGCPVSCESWMAVGCSVGLGGTALERHRYDPEDKRLPHLAAWEQLKCCSFPRLARVCEFWNSDCGMGARGLGRTFLPCHAMLNMVWRIPHL